MFHHKLGDSEFKSPTIRGIAVIVLDTENGGRVPAGNFTGKDETNPQDVDQTSLLIHYTFLIIANQIPICAICSR